MVGKIRIHFFLFAFENLFWIGQHESGQVKQVADHLTFYTNI